MAKRFEEKVVWITGGGSGIGRELALAFAREGAAVAVSGRRADRLEEVVTELRGMGANALAAPCDVTQEASLRDAVALVVAELGGLDVAVANAGFSVNGRIVDLTADDWRRQFDTNVVGAALTARCAVEALQQRGGRLAIVGSVAGVITAPGSGAYSASKAAVRAMAQALELELAPRGVSCTLLQPGFVESEIGQVDNEGRFHADRRDPRAQKLMWRASDAARVMVDAIARREREYTFTAHGKAVAFLGMHFPGVVHEVLKRTPKLARVRVNER